MGGGRRKDDFRRETPGRCCDRDVLDYAAPFGPVGRLVERAYLHSYPTAFLSIRANALKQLAETGQWKTLPGFG